MRYLFILVLIFSATRSGAEELSGPVDIIDGDTLTINGILVDLWGYDAPELNQQCTIRGVAWACGAAAVSHIQKFTHKKIVTCDKKPLTDRKVTTFKCKVGSLDIGAEMIEVGLALPDWPVSDQYYIQSFREARGQGLGMHRGSFDTPWDWRKAQPTK